MMLVQMLAPIANVIMDYSGPDANNTNNYTADEITFDTANTSFSRHYFLISR